MSATTSKRIKLFIPVNTKSHIVANVSRQVYSGTVQTAIGATTTAPADSQKVHGSIALYLVGIVGSGSKEVNGREVSRSFRVYCPRDKVEETMTALAGETIDGYKINDVRTPRKRVYI